tara:strand:- start:11056 stop:11715 length:660 start_codon:yes stop_codon:yes gene_type:complete
MSPSQLIFDISLQTRYNPEDFMVSKSNNEAFDYISSWPKWVDMGVFLYGPATCGKTHLAHVWAYESQAVFIKAEDLPRIDVAQTPLHIVVEDIQKLTPKSSESLFHLYNYLYQKKGNLIVTSDTPLANLTLSLKDLKSRLSRLVSLQMKSPDEDLMRLFIMKLFSDLQVTVLDNEINYLTTHLNRDFKYVFHFIKTLNNRSIAEKRKITIPFIKLVLGG